MSRRRKREVAPPPHTSSSYPPGVPTLSAVPYPYGGPWFATPPPAWFASPPSQAMPSSSVCPLPMAAKTNIELQHDFEEWGVESRPLGGFVNLINAPSNHMHHVAEGSPSRPINVENGDVFRTEKRLSWTNDEDLRLVSGLCELFICQCDVHHSHY
uniref:Uncharacterized protein n=1 Tax=Oryza barthii TaxID=65489 RepID=A0A0D3H1I5_9ORYZ